MNSHIFSPVLHQAISLNLSNKIPQQSASMYMYRGHQLGSNLLKGEWLERSTLGLVKSGLFEPKSHDWNLLTPHRIGRAGIDSLLVKMDDLGRPRDLMVAEAKFGASKLCLTKDGKQMSSSWIRPRLARTASQYICLADEIRDNGFLYSQTNPSNAIAVPMKDGAVVYVSRHQGKIYVGSSNRRVTSLQLEKQARRFGTYLSGASEGKISFRSRLIRLSIKEGRWILGLDRLDSTGTVTNKIKFEGKLPSQVQILLKRMLSSVIGEIGLPPEAVSRIVSDVYNKPELLSVIQKEARRNWSIGLDKGLVSAAKGAALIAVAIELGRSAFFSKEINYKQLARVGAASAGSAAVGYYVGAQIHSRMLATPLGGRIASLLPLRNATGSAIAGISSLAGGIASSLFFAIFGYTFGFLGAREAKVTAVAGTAGAVGALVFTSGALGAAMAWGTASTGVAISSLSGAAATNASLALLGGGSIAAGGGGMALGASILTGGAAIAGIIISAAVSIAHSKLDERSKIILALRKIHLAESAIDNNY